jgi:hypothetical protein
MTDKEILELRFYSNDLDVEITIKDFFKELLKKLFEDRDCFSGKRPFGNSDWDGDLCVCLIENKIVNGEIDKYGYIENCDWAYFDSVVQRLIESL